MLSFIGRIVGFCRIRLGRRERRRVGLDVWGPNGEGGLASCAEVGFKGLGDATVGLRYIAFQLS